MVMGMLVNQRDKNPCLFEAYGPARHTVKKNISKFYDILEVIHAVGSRAVKVIGSRNGPGWVSGCQLQSGMREVKTADGFGVTDKWQVMTGQGRG